MYYDRVYRRQGLPLAFMLFVLAWFIILCMMLVDNYVTYQKVTMNSIILLFIFLILIPVRLLRVIRERVFMYGDYLTYRRIIGTTDVYYNDVHKILYDPHYKKKGARRSIRWDILLVDSYGNTLVVLPLEIIGENAEQLGFVEYVMSKNKNVKTDAYVQGLLAGDTVDVDMYTRVISETYQGVDDKYEHMPIDAGYEDYERGLQEQSQSDSLSEDPQVKDSRLNPTNPNANNNINNRGCMITCLVLIVIIIIALPVILAFLPLILFFILHLLSLIS